MALDRLLKGFADFRLGYYREHLDLFEKLATEGQSPRILIIGCADARVDPGILTQTRPGDILTVRNIAAMVPPASSINASAMSIARRRQYDTAPENEEAAMWVDTVATATAGEIPTKISNGVIRNPPPMPNMPEMKPTASPIPNSMNTLTGRSAIGR